MDWIPGWDMVGKHFILGSIVLDTHALDRIRWDWILGSGVYSSLSLIKQDRVGMDWVPGCSQLSSLLGPVSKSQVHAHLPLALQSGVKSWISHPLSDTSFRFSPSSHLHVNVNLSSRPAFLPLTSYSNIQCYKLGKKKKNPHDEEHAEFYCFLLSRT